VRIFAVKCFFFSHDFSYFFKNLILLFFLAARVGRKRGKMNLEKTINKNMFDVSSSIRDSNPLQTSDILKNDQFDTLSTTSSILSHPKQKLTAQFKRAITMIKQRSEPTHESSSPKLLTSISLTEKPNYSLDSTLLTSLIEEHNHDDYPPLSPKSQTFVHIKPPLQDSDSSTITAATVITLEPTTRINHQNLSTPFIKSKNQQTVTPQISSSSATLSPTPSSSTTTTGEITMLVTNL
jgi:hypothetical protein